jgi:hypothetical protein
MSVATELRTRLSRSDVVARMRALSKAGKLPGFVETRGGGDGELFRVAAFATPFDRELIVRADRESEAETTLRWRLRVLPKLPIIMLVVSVLSVWPGVWLTDSMIRTYFPSYDFNTNLWYIPLTLASLAWYGWGAWKRSGAEARQSEAEAVAVMRAALTPDSHG